MRYVSYSRALTRRTRADHPSRARDPGRPPAAEIAPVLRSSCYSRRAIVGRQPLASPGIEPMRVFRLYERGHPPKSDLARPRNGRLTRGSESTSRIYRPPYPFLSRPHPNDFRPVDGAYPVCERPVENLANHRTAVWGLVVRANALAPIENP